MNEAQFDPQLFSDFFDAQPQAFLWLEPVWDEHSRNIIDFTYQYINDIGLRYLHLDRLELTGVRIFNTPSLTDEMRPRIFNEMVQVYQTGITSETQVYNPIINKHARVFRMKFRGGVLTIIQNSTEEKRAIQELSQKTRELEEQQAFSDSILDASPNGIFVAGAVHDANGAVVDFIVQRINPAFTRLLSLNENQVVGKRLLSLFPETKDNGVFDMYVNVYHTGIPGNVDVQYQQREQDFWYHVSSVKLGDGLLVTFSDITQQRKAAAETEQQRNLLENILKYSSNGISVGAAVRDEGGRIVDFQSYIVNEAAARLIGISKEDYLTKTGGQIDPGFPASPYFQDCVRTLETGAPFITQYHLNGPDRWLEVSVSKMDDDHLIHVFTDVTTIKEAQQLSEREYRLSTSILNASLNGIYVLEAIKGNRGIEDFAFATCNERVADLIGLPVEQICGKRFLTLFPQAKVNGLFTLFCQVLESGESHRRTTYYAQAFERWYDAMAVRLGENQLVITYQDITQQHEATEQIKKQKNLLDNILEHSPAGISVTEVIRDGSGVIIDGRSVLANEPAIRFTGISKEVALTKTIGEVDPALLASPIYQMALQTLTTDKPFHIQYFFEPTNRWLELSVSKMDEDHLINIITDVTTAKQAQLEFEQSMQRLEAVFNAAQSGMFTFSPVRDESGEIVDFRFVITNANFAGYVGQTPQILKGELGSTWFPGYLHNGVFDMYKTTFLTGETQRKDVHYNVDGHDLYLDLMSTKVMGEVLVTFTDYTQLKTVQLQLEKYVADLERSNRNLQEFAHAASHDLKEPIRKIQVFSDMLKGSFRSLSSEQGHLFSKVEDATKRMSMLIHDLLEYSYVNMGMDLVEEISLNKKVALALSDLELAIQEKQATITVGDLPKIKGHRRQWQQLFHNLVENALKYSKQDVAPEITITADKVTGKTSTFVLPDEEQNKSFHLIQVRDNGIGFEPEHAETIFQVFKRLHGKGMYSGSGVGLAIVRKVVENHNGYIKAKGEPGKGASFKILIHA